MTEQIKFKTNFKGDLSYLSQLAKLDTPYVDTDNLEFTTVAHYLGASRYANQEVRKVFAKEANLPASKVYSTVREINRMSVEFMKQVAVTNTNSTIVNPYAFRTDWDEVKDDCVRTALMHKFGDSNPRLRNLLATLDVSERGILFLNNWKDHFWGVNYDDHSEGYNYLGKLLTYIRTIILHYRELGIAIPSLRKVRAVKSITHLEIPVAKSSPNSEYIPYTELQAKYENTIASLKALGNIPMAIQHGQNEEIASLKLQVSELTSKFDQLLDALSKH